MWCGLTLITHIRGRRVRPKVIYTAGTIRTAQREIVKFIRKWIMDSQSLMETKRKEAQSALMIEEINTIVP